MPNRLRRLAVLHAAPELRLRREQIDAGRADQHECSISTHLPPPVMIDSTALRGRDDPHIVLKLRHVFLRPPPPPKTTTAA